jgi:hypothetical protein
MLHHASHHPCPTPNPYLSYAIVQAADRRRGEFSRLPCQHQRHTVITCPMPPKRPLQSSNEMSPPPSQRQTVDQEHHLSPMAGHHPEIPADAAMAINSPPRRMDNTNVENQSPPNSQSGAGQVANSTDDLADRPISSPQQDASATDPSRSAMVNGGARAAYAASQQQRIITCNLSSIPTSTA